MIDDLRRIHKRLRDAEKSGTLYPTFDLKQAERQGIIAREVSAELRTLGEGIATMESGDEKVLVCCLQGWLYLLINPKSKEVFERWDSRIIKTFKELEKD